MSTALGIASVSVLLVDLLNNGLIDHDVGSTVGGDVTVTALPPDRVLPNGGTESTQLNLFLYQATPNLGWSHVGQPARNTRGERIANPPLALDLHYLLSAYGQKDFHAEILLGYAMQLLHERPIIAREDIRRALAPPSPTNSTALPESLRDLATSELGEQVELIKITPAQLSNEEISKLWVAFQSHYRPTAAYEVSVVLIEGRRSARAALPVRADGDRVYVRPIQHPVVDSVRSSAGPNEPIVATSTLVVRGRDLEGDVTSVRIGDVELTPADENVTPTEIRVSLSGSGVRAGPQGLQVVQQVQMGEPARPHRGVESNLATFVLRPTIASAITKTLTSPAAGVQEGTISFDVTPRLRAGQRVVLLLNELLPIAAPPDAVAAAFSFRAAPLTSDSDTARFEVAGLTDGTYLVRVQVDGAESPLELDAGTKRYERPKVVIP